MVKCPHYSGCHFYTENFRGLPAFSQLYHKQYCEGDFQACARYVVLERKRKKSKDIVSEAEQVRDLSHYVSAN